MDAVKLLTNLLKNNSMGSNILGGLLGGNSGEQSPSSGGGDGLGGLGALAGMLGGGSGSSHGGGGAGGLLSSILGGGDKGGSGGLGALAGMLGGAGAGGLLAKLMGGGDEEQVQAAVSEVPEQANQEAELLICAMCNAAKADGRLDANEKEKIVGRLGDEVTQDEIDFVERELSAPLDVDEFVRSVPRGTEQQVYSFSVMAIKIDEQSEANYLGRLAQGLGLEADTCNAIHDQLGAPKIFS